MKYKLLYRLLLLVTDFRLILFNHIRQILLKILTNTQKNYHLIVCSGIFVEEYELLKIGDYISFNHDCYISAYGGVEIG